MGFVGFCELCGFVGGFCVGVGRVSSLGFVRALRGFCVGIGWVSGGFCVGLVGVLGGFSVNPLNPPKTHPNGRGIYFRNVFCFLLGFVFRFGFLASWLLGFLASWLFSFLASWLFGFSAFGLFGFLLVYAAFGGFLALAFRILCIPSSSSAAGGYAAFGGFGFSHPLLSQFLSGLFVFCTLSLVFWIWLPASSALPVPPYLNHFFERHGKKAPPPTHPLLFRLFAE